MSSEALAAPRAPQVAYPAPIALGAIVPWAVFALALLALVYLVGAEQGATAVVPGMSVHEWMHDGRHLLGFPCH